MFALRVAVLTPLRRLASGLGLGLSLAACPADIEPPKTKREPAPAAAQERAEQARPAAAPTSPAPGDSENKSKADATPSAKLRDDVPLPITKLLGKSPIEVQEQLGEHLSKGMARTTCVRFTPDRVFFECAFAYQRYADKTSTFSVIAVTYEDGKSVGVAFEGLPGEGGFTPEAALATVGLELPTQGRLSQPRKGVNLWTWFNDRARLEIHGLQYRVEVSSVDNTWPSGKVDIIANSPLTEAQRAKIKQTQPRNTAG